MKQAEVLEKYTDFISDKQQVLIWEFNSAILQRAYDTYSYSFPVVIALFRSLRSMAASGNSQVRDRSFFIFMGD